MMTRGETLSVQFGFCTGGKRAIAASTGRVLSLREPDVARFARGLLAVIDATGETSAEAYEILERSFRKQSDASSVEEGREELYVAGVLERLAGLGLGRDGQSVIVAVWLGSDLLLGSLGSSRVFLCREDGIQDVTRTVPAIEGSEVRLTRFQLQLNDILVMVSGALDSGLDLRDVQQTVLYSSAQLSLHDQAAWLVNIASARSGPEASAAIMQFSASPSLHGVFQRRARSGSTVRVRGLIAATVVVAAGLASAGVVLTSVLAQGTLRHKVAPAATATPVVLTAYPKPRLARPFGTLAFWQAGHVSFCWQDRIPAQVVQLEVQSGSARTRQSVTPARVHVVPPSLQCTAIALHNGRSYQWRLTMSAPGYLARSTIWHSFRIASPPRPRRAKPKHVARARRTTPPHAVKTAKRR